MLLFDQIDHDSLLANSCLKDSINLGIYGDIDHKRLVTLRCSDQPPKTQ
jgi:hypothetical protein